MGLRKEPSGRRPRKLRAGKARGEQVTGSCCGWSPPTFGSFFCFLGELLSCPLLPRRRTKGSPSPPTVSSPLLRSRPCTRPTAACLPLRQQGLRVSSRPAEGAPSSSGVRAPPCSWPAGFSQPLLGAGTHPRVVRAVPGAQGLDSSWETSVRILALPQRLRPSPHGGGGSVTPCPAPLEACGSGSGPLLPEGRGPSAQEHGSCHGRQPPPAKPGPATTLPASSLRFQTRGRCSPSPLRPTGDGACCCPSSFLTPAYASVHSPSRNSPRRSRGVCTVCSPPGSARVPWVSPAQRLGRLYRRTVRQGA